MSHNYRSLEDGQIIVSDEPRTDLEALSRWEQITDEEAAEIAAAPVDETSDETPTDVSELAAFVEEHELSPADVLGILTAAVLVSPNVIETIPGTENEPPTVIVGTPVTDEEAKTLPAAIVTLPDGTVAGGDEITTLTEEAPKPRGRRKPAEKDAPE